MLTSKSLVCVGHLAKYSDDEARNAHGEWSSGTNGAVESATATIRPEVVKAKSILLNNAAKFAEASGAIQKCDDEESCAAALQQLHDQVNMMYNEDGEKEMQTDTGLSMTAAALNEGFETGGAIVATVEDAGIAGAAQVGLMPAAFDDGDGNMIPLPGANDDGEITMINYMGSTQIADGAGSAMTLEALRIAADNDTALVVQPKDGSAGEFWENKLGMTQDLDESFVQFSREEVHYLAGH